MKLGLALLACGACARGGAADVADEFVGYYFVDIAQDRALALATGAARQKLTEELRLVASVRRGGYGPAQARADVSWRRDADRVDGDRARVEYEVTVRAGGGESRRRALISLRREATRWRVSNYQVLDVAPGAGGR